MNSGRRERKEYVKERVVGMGGAAPRGDGLTAFCLIPQQIPWNLLLWELPINLDLTSITQHNGT